MNIPNLFLKAKPIVFSASLIPAIIDGRKTMTRRVIKPQPIDVWWCIDSIDGDHYYDASKGPDIWLKPRYQPGDLLWVQEAWRFVSWLGYMEYEVEFRDGTRIKFRFTDKGRADKWKKYRDKKGWQSPYFMPREAARTFLRVIFWHIERLHEISNEDALKEGVLPTCKEFSGCVRKSVSGLYGKPPCPKGCNCYNARENFFGLWDALNAKRDGGAFAFMKDPYVGVYEFQREVN